MAHFDWKVVQFQVQAENGFATWFVMFHDDFNRVKGAIVGFD